LYARRIYYLVPGFTLWPKNSDEQRSDVERMFVPHLYFFALLGGARFDDSMLIVRFMKWKQHRFVLYLIAIS
jgi:hypothetical protein